LIFNHQVIGVFASTHHHELLQEQILILNHYIKNFLWEEKWTKENALDELTSSLNKKSFLLFLLLNMGFHCLPRQPDTCITSCSAYKNVTNFIPSAGASCALPS